MLQTAMMILLLRIANIVMLFLYVLGSIIRIPPEISRFSKEGLVPLIAFLALALFVFALHALSLYCAWRGLGSTSTLRAVQSAWRLNLALGLWGLYQIVSFLNKLEDLPSNLIFTLLVVLNLVALGKRKSVLNAMPSIERTGIPPTK